MYFFRTISRVVIAFLLLMTLMFLCVSLSPNMPASGLDSSWIYGLNQAVAQGLVFGKDILFTFGPYGSIYTQQFHPATDFRMVWGGAYLGFCYWLAIVFLMRSVPLKHLTALLLMFGFLMFSRDALLFSYPLLVALVCYRLTENKSLKNFSGDILITALIAVIFSALGLLILIKGTLIIICALMAMGSCVLMLLSRQKLFGCVGALGFIFGAIIFWKLADQPLGALPVFLKNMGPIISGYTEAMAIGPKFLILDIFLWAFLVGSLIFLGQIFRLKNLTFLSKSFLLCVFGLFLWMGFKAGFVRFDMHFIEAGTVLLMAFFLWPFAGIKENKYVTAMLWLVSLGLFLAQVLLLCLISHGVFKNSLLIQRYSETFDSPIQLYINSFQGIKERLKGEAALLKRFDAQVAEIKQQASFPVMPGSTDIYPVDLSELIASGNHWSPRLVLQSYSAYTPDLALADANYLLGPNAPENIIFRVYTQDNLLPALYGDGSSWPILLKNYEPFESQSLQGDFVFLHKKPGINSAPVFTPVLNNEYAMGQEIKLSSLDAVGPVFAKIDIRPSWLGKLIGILFKPSQLQINLVLADGTHKTYRILAETAESGFILSPLIEKNSDFFALYQKNNDSEILKNQQVMEFSVTTSSGFGQFRAKLWAHYLKLEIFNFK